MSHPPFSAPPRPGLPGPAEIRLQLQRLLPPLAEFGRREEAQFMEVGQQLGDFLQRSRIISRYADTVIDSLLRKDGEEILSALHTLIDDLEGHISRLFAAARRHQESLQQVTAHIQGIDAPLQSLSKVTKVLHSLSVSTKVESTQGHSVVVLKTLADDLKGLANKIHGKTEAVRERLKSMAALAAEAREKTQTMAEISLHQAASHARQSRTLLETVAMRRQAALADARSLQDDTAAIAAALHEVISSVQFHDITRQQVEHVELALQEFCRRLDAGELQGRLALETGNLCRVQSAQLRHTRHDLVTAVQRMISSLRSIAPSVQQLARQTRLLSTSTESAGSALFKDVEAVLTTVTAVIARADQDDRQALNAVAEVLNVLGELSQLLQDVESIGTEMKMISLNAGITAAHNLERGAGLGVIARTIQALSSEVLTRTDEFAVVYREMDALARDLSGSDEQCAAADTGTNGLSASAATFLTRLQSMNQEGIASLEKLDAEALTLAAAVIKSAGAITIHIEAGKIIDPLVAGFEGLAVQVEGDEAVDGDAKILEMISQNYTMQSERRVHAAVRHSGRAVAEEAAADQTGLGSNVELF